MRPQSPTQRRNPPSGLRRYETSLAPHGVTTSEAPGRPRSSRQRQCNGRSTRARFAMSSQSPGGQHKRSRPLSAPRQSSLRCRSPSVGSRSRSLSPGSSNARAASSRPGSAPLSTFRASRASWPPPCLTTHNSSKPRSSSPASLAGSWRCGTPQMTQRPHAPDTARHHRPYSGSPRRRPQTTRRPERSP